jgi:hypothetical protein
MYLFLYKNRIPKISPKLLDYCIKSRNNSIRKISKNYNEEIKIKKFVFPSNTSISIPFDPNSNIDFFFSIICLLSSSTILYYFYKTSK